jgi:L-fuculose-phosphate aldolase
MRRADRADRRAVVAAARALVERGLVVGSVGNVSVRSAAGMRITPTRVPYEKLRTRDVVDVGLDGSIAEPRAHGPSREWPFHAAVYRTRPDVGAVIHTHSPYATALSCGGHDLTAVTEEFEYYGVPTVRITRPAPAGTAALAEAVVEALGGAGRGCLIRHHGVVAVADDVATALTLAQVVEHQAMLTYLVGRQRTDGHRGRRVPHAGHPRSGMKVGIPNEADRGIAATPRP